MTTVTFNDELIIHFLYDSDDEKEARIGKWEEIARDRERFTKRVETIDKKIGWIFKTKEII